ncbi:MAG: PEP-CTERM sorting domain-containing protein [Phycisphaeraceae bacterium]
MTGAMAAGATTAVPEPTSLALLTLGALLLPRRRRSER